MGYDPDLRIGTKATADGPAFYPFGTWGSGYILDERAKRRLARWHRWRIWVQTAAVMLFIPDFMPGSRGLRFAVYMIVMVTLAFSIYWYCVRDCRRTAVRLTTEESLQIRAEATPHGAVGLVVVVIALMAAGAIWLGFFAARAHRSPLMAAAGFAVCGWMAVELARVGAMKRRLDRRPSSRPPLWTRRR